MYAAFMKRIGLALAVLLLVARAGADETQATASYEAKQWHRCAEQWMDVASHSHGDTASNAFYNVACCRALDHDANGAFAALARAQAAGLHELEHVREDADLVSLHGDARWEKLLVGIRANLDAFEKTFGDPSLRRELLALSNEDQGARNALIQSKFKDEAARTRVRAIDTRSTARMKQVVARYGWPGYRLVGKDGANAAWLLVQHADRDPAFQKLCVAQMERAVKLGDADSANWAYLVDRVAVAENRKQVYGTQFDGHQQPLPIEDEAHVDQRRKSVGLSTMAEYRKSMLEVYGEGH
jgi:hypothetical protein